MAHEHGLVTTTVFDRQVTVARSVLPKLKRIEKKWRARGGHDWYPVDVVGGHADRNIAGTDTPSQHGHGWAIDINPSRNPVRQGRVVSDMPREFVKMWQDEGFGWGGNWNSKKDPMHFSLAQKEGGTGLSGDPNVNVAFEGVGAVPQAGEVRSVFEQFVGRSPRDFELSHWTGRDLNDIRFMDEAQSFTAAKGFEAFAESVQQPAGV